MRVYASVPFRYPAITGHDYPYGYQDFDDAFAQTLISAGVVVDATKPGGGAGGISRIDGAPDYPTAELPAEIALIANKIGIATKLTASQIQSTLADGTAPTGNNTIENTTAGTTSFTGFANFSALDDGDEIVFNPFLGTAGQWVVVATIDTGLNGPGMLKNNTTNRKPAIAIPGAGGDFQPPASFACNVPYADAPSGTVGANGALTLSSALVATTGSGYYVDGIWLNFPQGAVSATAATPGYAAGAYWTTFTSQLLGTVHNNVYAPGTNSGAGSWQIPSSATAFSGITGAAYTGISATDTTSHAITLTNPMGPGGKWLIDVVFRTNNSAGTKQVYTFIGATKAGLNSGSLTTANAFNPQKVTLRNKGRVDRNFGPTQSDVVISNGSPYQYTTIDTSGQQAYALKMQRSSAADYIIIESCEFTFVPGI